MHELGICDALLKMVRNIAEEEELSKVVIKLCGEFVVEELEGTARCMDCGEEFAAAANRLRCPGCGGEKLVPLTGRDLTLKEILAS